MVKKETVNFYSKYIYIMALQLDGGNTVIGTEFIIY